MDQSRHGSTRDSFWTCCNSGFEKTSIQVSNSPHPTNPSGGYEGMVGFFGITCNQKLGRALNIDCYRPSALWSTRHRGKPPCRNRILSLIDFLPSGLQRIHFHSSSIPSQKIRKLFGISGFRERVNPERYLGAQNRRLPSIGPLVYALQRL